MFGMLVTVVVPRPDWVLLDVHQCINSPSVELHHSANAYSCSSSSKITEGQASAADALTLGHCDDQGLRVEPKIAVVVGAGSGGPDAQRVLDADHLPLPGPDPRLHLSSGHQGIHRRNRAADAPAIQYKNGILVRPS